MPLVALIVLPLLLYLPGLLIGRALVGPQQPADLLERHYERVVIGALLNGWLALLLAEFGLFSIWLHSALIATLCTFLWLRVVGKQHTPIFGFAGFAPLREQFKHPSSRGKMIEIAAFALVGLVAFLLVLRPFEVILGVRDAGVYSTTGLAIARTGGIVQYDPLLADLAQSAQSSDPAVAGPAEQAMTNFIGVQNPERFIATRLRAVGFFVLEGEATHGRVVPQGLHLLPVWIALLASVGGPYVGLWATALLGLLGAWSVGMLGRRLAGPAVGILAFALLALNTTQVWFSRYSTAETAMQFLLFAGLYAFARWTMDDGPWTTDSKENRSYRPSSIVHRPLFYPALAGFALGQIAFARIDFFLASGPAVPLVAYLLYVWLSHRWRRGHTALAVAFGLMVVHALLHILFISRAYFFDTAANRLRDYAITAYLALPFLTETMREVTYTTTSSPLKDPMRIWRELAAVALALAALVALRRWPQPLLFVEAQIRRWARPVLTVSAAAILLLAGWAYAVRPGIIDGDMLTGAQGGWSDPLLVDPSIVQSYWVEGQRITPSDARQQFGVALASDAENCRTTLDVGATEALRRQMRENRGPWQGPLSVQTPNWLRLQGYVGAPISVPWCERAVYAIPQANFVRVGWYLSPLGMVLACVGFALWWRRMNAASWLMLTVGLLATFFYVRQTYGTGDQTYIYILRRFVPTVYPALTLAIAYAIVALGSIKLLPGYTQTQIPTGNSDTALGFAAFRKPSKRHLPFAGFAALREAYRLLPQTLASALACALLAFFAVTGLPVFRHVEYAGAVEQISDLANRFGPNDILLLRGGGPGFERDLPDLVATPLRFAFGIDALAVKSRYPAEYADALAGQVRHWQAAGRTVYVAYSSSGGDFALPGFSLTLHGTFELRINEFEQLKTQKPRNVQSLALPLAIYRLDPGQPGVLTTIQPSQTALTPRDFAAQVRGFHRPEAQRTPDGATFAWTNGDALLRLPWSAQSSPRSLTLLLSGGQRPERLGPAEVCVSVVAEQRPQLPDNAAFIPLGCRQLTAAFAEYTFVIDPQTIGSSATGSLLLRLASPPWVPAEQDPRLLDARPVGIQFATLTLR